MLKPGGARAEEARRKAQEQFAKVKQRDAEALKEREKIQAADAAKTARLRALRLAKEAADEAAAAQAAAAAKPVVVRRKRAPAKSASAAESE
jgi:hypothetical protein